MQCGSAKGLFVESFCFTDGSRRTEDCAEYALLPSHVLGTQLFCRVPVSGSLALGKDEFSSFDRGKGKEIIKSVARSWLTQSGLASQHVVVR